MTSQYRRGADFERVVKKALEAQGAIYVVRAAGSKGAVDLVAFWGEESTELAWAAGFFDGEGCTTGDWRREEKGKTGYLHLTVVQNDKRPLERFHRAVGVGTIRPKTTANPSARAWAYLASGRTALYAITRLWPYLSEPKREQARRQAARAGLPEPSRVALRTLFVQCKKTAKLTKAEAWTLTELATQCGCVPVLAKSGYAGRGITFSVLGHDDSDRQLELVLKDPPLALLKNDESAA